MRKKKIEKKDNVVNFPSRLTPTEKEIEAIIFAAAEPLDVDTIESKLSKKVNIEKSLEKLKIEYSFIVFLKFNNLSRIFLFTSNGNNKIITIRKILKKKILNF